jgi:hypothetical protein
MTNGTGKASTSLHSNVSSAGTYVKTGAVMSCTVMTCVAVATLPHASVAVKVRVKM